MTPSPEPPLVDYMGDAVLEISILPNNARNTSVLGVARELAALTGRKLRKPDTQLQMSGESIDSKVKIEISNRNSIRASRSV